MLLLDENNACDFLAECTVDDFDAPPASKFNPGDILVDGSAAWHPYVRVVPARLFATKTAALAARRAAAIARAIKARRRK